MRSNEAVKSSFIQLCCSVQYDGPRRALRLLDLRVDQKSLSVPAHVINELVKNIWAPDGHGVPSDSFREIHAANKIFETRIGAKSIQAEIDAKEVGKIERSFLICVFQMFELPLFPKASVNHCDHVG